MISDSCNSLSELDCTQLFKELKAEMSWEWDSRFGTALALIPDEKKDSVGAMLEKYLGAAWDDVTIEKAPENVQSVLVRLGGIMHGQLLFAATLPLDGIIFCAWWPWGNGRTVSVRIGTNPKGIDLLDALVVAIPE